MHLLVEEFLKDNLEFKLDVLETLENHREEFIDWRRALAVGDRGRERNREGGGLKGERRYCVCVCVCDTASETPILIQIRTMPCIIIRYGDSS